MDLQLSAAHLRFRNELRAWLAANLPRPWRAELRDLGATETSLIELRRAWQKKLYQAGYLGMDWPEEWGGRGGTEIEKSIMEAELARRRATRSQHPRHRAPRPRAHPPRQRGAAPPLHPAHALGRRDLVPGLQRAGGGQRPRRAQDRGTPGRRPLRAERPEGVDHLRPVGRLDRRPRAHRREGPLRRHLLPPREARHAGRGDRDARRKPARPRPAPDERPHVHCDGSTGNSLVDEAADFPGPQAQSIAGTVQLSRLRTGAMRTRRSPAPLRGVPAARRVRTVGIAAWTSFS